MKKEIFEKNFHNSCLVITSFTKGKKKEKT